MYLIQHYCKFKPKFSIKNSSILVKNIKDLHIPHNAILVSFDVKNLFPSIPPNKVVQLTEKLLLKNKVNLMVIEEIIDSLKICLEQNYFEFNNNIYISKEGLIMGNPISPLLAEIFMDDLESKISKHPLFKLFTFWYRYVDDILGCFNGTRRQLEIFLAYINSLDTNIKFTLELQKDFTLVFLDLTLKVINNKIDFSTFHKPSQSDLIIHNSSMHPFSHKIAVFHSYLHRLVNTPLSDENFEKELNIIKQIAINNGYNPSLIDILLNKKLDRLALNSVFPSIVNQNSNMKYYTLTYFGRLTDKISKHLRNPNYRIAYKVNNTLGKFIKNNKSKIDISQKAGVYKLSCGSCDKLYIGQTGRCFPTRIKEHFDNSRKSNYREHIVNENHTPNMEYEVLHLYNKSIKLNLFETLEINRRRYDNVLLNDQVDLNNSPLLNL